jgi:hypothetical protein
MDQHGLAYKLWSTLPELSQDDTTNFSATQYAAGSSAAIRHTDWATTLPSRPLIRARTDPQTSSKNRTTDEIVGDICRLLCTASPVNRTGLDKPSQLLCRLRAVDPEMEHDLPAFLGKQLAAEP